MMTKSVRVTSNLGGRLMLDGKNLADLRTSRHFVENWGPSFPQNL